MARPQREGLLYFSFDVDFFSNKEIKILKAKHGAKGLLLRADGFESEFYKKD